MSLKALAVSSGSAALVSVWVAAWAADPPGEPGLLRLEVTQAVRTAVAHSPELAAAGFEAEIVEAFAEEQRAVFDPLLTLVAGREQVVGRDLSSSGILFDYQTDDFEGEAVLSQLLPTGTLLELGAVTEIVDESRDGRALVEAAVGARVSQPILGGTRLAANRGHIRAAMLEAEAARWEARVLAESLATLVEQTCWDARWAEASIGVIEASVADARALMKEIDDRVASGALASSERVAAESEVALRQQQLVEARLDLDLARALLAGYLGPEGEGAPLEIADALEPVDRPPGSVEEHLATARSNRPDVAMMRELSERAEVEVVRTKHGLLPRLDVWAEGAIVGYDGDSGGAWHDIDGDHWRFSAGIAIEQPLARTESRADYSRERARRSQIQRNRQTVDELIVTEVRTAHAMVRRWSEAVEAIAVTRALDEEKLRIEEERFDLGRASSFQVARAQRDLLERRLEELEAVAEQRKAWAELRRAEGRQLASHGIDMGSIAVSNGEDR